MFADMARDTARVGQPQRLGCVPIGWQCRPGHCQLSGDGRGSALLREETKSASRRPDAGTRIQALGACSNTAQLRTGYCTAPGSGRLNGSVCPFSQARFCRSNPAPNAMVTPTPIIQGA